MILNGRQKLILIKGLHTVIWVFFNIVIFYLLWAVISNRIDRWVWTCLGIILGEGLLLLLFKNICPVTLMAKKFSSSDEANFDIYLPNWLAKYNKTIYTIIVFIAVLILIYQLKQNHI